MKQDKTWAIIPAYNEEKDIKGVIRDTKKYVKNILIIDDGSKDRTYEITKREGVTAVKHIINLGKGAALKTGCDFAVKSGAEILVVLDADAQHEPKEIPNFIRSLKDVDMVFGYRQLEGMPFILKFGNLCINKITQLLFKIRIRDTQSGYRAFTSRAYRKIRWKASNYSMESEMIANLGKHKLKYKEIPIRTIYTDRYKGTTVLDGIKIVFNMIWWRLTK